MDILEIEIQGELTYPEIEKMMDDYFSNPHRNVLIDLRGGNFDIISRGEMVRIIQRFKDPSVEHTVKSAVVTTRDEDIGFAKLLKNIGKMEQIPTKYKIFRNIEQAMDWLRS